MMAKVASPNNNLTTHVYFTSSQLDHAQKVIHITIAAELGFRS